MVMDKRQPRMKFPTEKAKAMKKMPDGNPYPYELPDMAHGGITEPEVTESVRAEQKYTPKPSSNIGDEGKG